MGERSFRVDAGRGFHYQDAVATELAVLAWRGDLTLLRLIPEGLEDVSLELDAHPLHLQAKSRRAHRGDFSDSEVADGWRHLAERLAADPVAHVGLVLERPLRGADTGFELTLADLADPRLKSTLAAAVRGIVAPDEFLARAHLLVMPAAPATSVDCSRSGSVSRRRAAWRTTRSCVGGSPRSQTRTANPTAAPPTPPP